tara:strand:+ start:81297 stop:82148 length:852 start_codon:yes stop_codon:yes gene_type:complete
MKKIVIVSLLFFSGIINAQIKPSLTTIPVSVFVNNAQTTIEDIIVEGNQTKKKVEELFNNNVLVHELTGPDADFSIYWEAFGSQWKWIKFRKDEAPLLIFLGLNSYTDEREYVELYDVSKGKQARLFAEPGRLIAYKRHPLTDELILYTHKYPCCRSASHNIYTLRRINGEIKSKDRFFIGRDSGDMVGPFYPDSVQFDGEYKQLEQKTALRWSPAVVEENAFEMRAQTNIIIHYEKGALYKELAIQDDWIFVIMYTGISEETSPVINHVNFKNKGVYGWIKR